MYIKILHAMLTRIVNDTRYNMHITCVCICSFIHKFLNAYNINYLLCAYVCSFRHLYIYIQSYCFTFVFSFSNSFHARFALAFHLCLYVTYILTNKYVCICDCIYLLIILSFKFDISRTIAAQLQFYELCFTQMPITFRQHNNNTHIVRFLHMHMLSCSIGLALIYATTMHILR